ncbi:MAG: SDR family oxidoreductase [Chlorobiales bacterium]|nr:SDR family oxidoreductase [Chlorobiales bacterium]
MIDLQIEEKVVLITGANHGIGAAAAKAFTAQGAKVFLTYFREPCEHTPAELESAQASGKGGVLLYRANQQQMAESVLESISSFGGTATAKEIDLSDTRNIPLLFNYCENALGPVDILVNNHTYCALDTFDPAMETTEGFGIHTITADDININCAINTRSYALMMSEYTRRFLEREAETGRIINLSTDAAHAHESNVSYAASKHAIESYSRSAAVELGRYGITVNIVAPGPIQTGYLTPEEETHIAANTPLRRIGKPQDVADVIVFLASEQARWLTGQLIYVGGGWRVHQ